MPPFLEKMSDGERAILGGSVVVLIAMFLPWWGADWNLGTFGGTSLGSQSESVSGFHGWGWITFLALLAVVVFWLLRGPLADQFELPDLPVSDGQAYMIGGGLEILGAVIFWLAYKGDNLNFPGFSAGVKFGVFVAIVGGAATVVGGYLKQSEPETLASAGNLPAPPPAGYGAPPPPATPPA
jgi:MFS family permease